MVSSEHTVKEYINKPDETRMSFILVNGETYYRTGDYVRRPKTARYFTWNAQRIS